METNINPADITHPITPPLALPIRPLLLLPMQNHVLKSLSTSIDAVFSTYPALLRQVVPSSSPQHTSLPAQITKSGQAVHYFKFTACPFGLPQGGIKSGFGWRGDLGPNPKTPSPPTLLQFYIKSYQIKFNK